MPHRPATARRPVKAVSKVPPHPYVENLAEAADHRGRRTCVACNLIGSAGDAHHPINQPKPPRRVPAALAEAYRQRDYAVLGETGDDQ